MYTRRYPRIVLKNLSIGTDNLLTIDAAIQAQIKKPNSICVKHGDVVLDGVQLSTYMDDGKLFVSKADLDKMGYTFVADLLKLVNKGFVYRGKTSSANNGMTGYIQTKAPSKPMKQEELAQFDTMLIPANYLLSILGGK